MNLNGRVKKLEELEARFYPEPDPQETAALEEEWAQWEIDNADWLRRSAEVGARFNELLTAACELMTEEEQAQAEEGAALLGNFRDDGLADGSWEGSPWCWLDGIFECGRSRLPLDLDPDDMRLLLLVRINERCRMRMDLTCTGCGLQVPCGRNDTWWPKPVSRFFPACPHCGGEDFEWSIHIGAVYHGKTYPWMKLPGYLGPQPPGGPWYRWWVPEDEDYQEQGDGHE
jgi:hypothetical protein